ncbi:MAG: hypothetical protein IT384_12455 [Deltaproteobacteria bacterium]|nr:hypothetical protein [Deltaproteobacteria bacterium]
MSAGFERWRWLHPAALAFALSFARSAGAEPEAPKTPPVPTSTTASTPAETYGFSKEELELMTSLDQISDLDLLERWELLRLMPLLEGDDDE